MCATWSRLRFHPGGPPPLRNLAHPWGFPWLSKPLAQKAQDGNELVKFSIKLCKELHTHLAVYLLEHPEDLGKTARGDFPASIWQVPDIKTLAEETRAYTVAFHQCDPELTGENCAPTSKPTRLLGTAALLAEAGFGMAAIRRRTEVPRSTSRVLWACS